MSPRRRTRLAVLPVAASVAVTTALLAAPAVAAPTASDPATVAVDTSFAAGSSVTSANGLYQLLMQTDGNLVEYGGGRALWNSGTAGSSAAYLRVQGDGNVVLYTADGRAVWFTATAVTGVTGLRLGDDGSVVVADGGGAETWGVHPHPETLPAGAVLYPGQSLLAVDGSYRLTVQGDGNVVVYSGTGVAVWWTGTSGAVAGLAMQTDGNLVLYRASGAPAWTSGTRGAAAAVLTQNGDATASVGTATTTAWRSGTGTTRLWRGTTLAAGAQLVAGGTRLVMQTDGNLVSYDPTGVALWTTQTFVPGTTAALQSDGNLVLYTPTGTAVWNSGTYGTSATYLTVSTGGRVAFLGSAARAPVWVQGPPNWTALAACESGGNPRAVNPAGYYGLYQFDLSTWASNGGTGNPVDASPAVQTAVAATLYLARGRQPWPVCGRNL